jgi:general secretion pathway protein H
MTVGAATRTAGFTLLELMVVLVLIGIIFSFATLSMRGDDLAELMEREAQRLEMLLAVASDEAVLRGDELALYVEDNGYEFMTLVQDGWQVPDDGMLRRYDMPADIRLELDLGDELPTPAPEQDKETDEQATEQPQIFILSSGEMTPFTLTFSSGGSLKYYQIITTLLGNISLESGESP